MTRIRAKKEFQVISTSQIHKGVDADEFAQGGSLAKDEKP